MLDTWPLVSFGWRSIHSKYLKCCGEAWIMRCDFIIQTPRGHVWLLSITHFCQVSIPHIPLKYKLNSNLMEYSISGSLNHRCVIATQFDTCNMYLGQSKMMWYRLLVSNLNSSMKSMIVLVLKYSIAHYRHTIWCTTRILAMGISQAMSLTKFYSRRNACCTSTPCDRVPHIWVSKFTIIGSDNCLSPNRCIGSKWPIVMYCVHLFTRVSEVQIDVKMCAQLCKISPVLQVGTVTWLVPFSVVPQDRLCHDQATLNIFPNTYGRSCRD